MRVFLILILLTASFVFAQDNLPGEVGQVIEYIMKNDYPEVYKEKEYRFRLRGYEVIDIDDDGITEIILMTHPHYHQSPSILIYQLRDEKVVRVTEGLAPGPLVPVDGEFLDCHTLGLGIDVTLASKNNRPIDMEKVITKMIEEKGGQIVVYNRFIHIGTAAGSSSLVDMRHQKNFSNQETCEKFQFSVPEDFKAGFLQGQGKKKFLVFKVGIMLYAYIIKIRRDGLLDKEIREFPLPGDFVSFDRRSSMIGYITKAGKPVKLVLSFVK